MKIPVYTKTLNESLPQLNMESRTSLHQDRVGNDSASTISFNTMNMVDMNMADMSMDMQDRQRMIRKKNDYRSVPLMRSEANSRR